MMQPLTRANLSGSPPQPQQHAVIRASTPRQSLTHAQRLKARPRAFMASPPSKRASLVVAKVVPAVLVLIVAYVSYVVVGPLSVDYLLNPPDYAPQRTAVGIAVPIVWFALLFPVAVTYIRLLLIVIWEPGYVSLGDEKTSKEAPSEFWLKDVYLCDPNGFPIYCQYCQNWKLDRAHHNQDVGRCTLKMDHFCPWVGGVVGERSFKFFVQFLVYSLLLSTYLMVLMAYFVHESHSHIMWIVALALGGFFVMFTLGMVFNSLWLIFMNVTSIENIDRMNRTMLLAVSLPPELQPSHDSRELAPPQMAAGHSPARSFGNDSERPLTSELDDPSHSSYFSNVDQNRPIRRLARSEYWRGTATFPQEPGSGQAVPASRRRTFAILETPPGMNPWDLGTPWRNFREVFGEKFHQWFLPFRHSPCCDHSSAVSFYPLGPQFEQLLEDAGLVRRPITPREKDGSVAASSRKRRRKLDRGWQNGERPDGWWSMKESKRRSRLPQPP